MPMTLQRLVRRAAREVLVSLENLEDFDARQETEMVIVSPWKVTIQARRIDAAGERQLDREKPAWIPGNKWARLHEVQRNAILAATDKPVPMKVLARLAGYKLTSYFRGAVTALVRAGLLRRVPDGLCSTQQE